MEEDLVIALSVLLEVDEAAARGIAARLGLGGRLAGNQFAAGFQKAATSGTAKAAGAVGKAASSGGSQKQAGVAAGQQFVDGYKTALTQIVSVTRASLKDQSAIQRQGTKGGQVDVDAQRAALDRRTLEKRRREYELGNEFKTRSAVELADVKRHNASLIAADQQAGVRRTVLIRTMLNNMTRINQTALSGILSMWKSHQQRKLQDEASLNRRAEMELQSSMSRRTSIIRSATKEQVAAQQQAMTPSDKFNQASSTGVLGVATGRSYALGGLIGGAMGARTAYNILGEFQFIETAFKGIFDEVEGRAPKTQEFLKTMQDFARESPYDFEQVARSAQKMFATRVVDLEELGYDKATDSVINRLQVLADAAAASGKTSAQMELALTGLGQIGSVGQLMMEETRQVTENLGLPIEEVAKSLGMSVAEMRDAMKAGEIDAETGLNAMFDAMTRIPGAAGAAARQAKTLRGAMSQLADVGKQMIVQFLMPVAKGFTAIALAFTNVGGALVSSGGGWKVVRDGLRGVIAALSAIVALKGAIEIVKILGFALSAAVSAPVITGFAVLVGLLSSFDGVRESLAALAEGTANWFLVGYRAKAVVDDFSGFVKVMTTIGKFARTVQDFTKALVVGTKDWFLVGYRISGVIDEFSNIVLFQTSLGAAARVIVNALRGIWDALGALANTRDFGEFRKALGKIAEDAGKALSPIKDALAKQFGLGVDAAKRAAEKALKSVVGWVGDNMDSIVAGARAASGGALVLRMLGLAKGGDFIGAARLGIAAAVVTALVGAAKSLATDQTAAEFAKSIDAFLEKAIDRAFDAAVIVTAIGAKLGGLVGDVWGSLFGDDKGGGAADPKASLSVADKIAGTLTAAWEKASVLLSGLASSVSEWFTTTFTSWLINLPYKIGELLSSTILEDEVIQAVGTIAAGVAAAAIVVGVKFAQGFIMGIIRSIPDIARMFRDAVGGALGGDIGTEFAGAMLTSIVAAFVGFKGFKAIAGAFAKLQIGFDASGPRAARNELAKLKVEAQGSGSKIADLGMKVARISDAAGKATSGLASLAERSGRNMQALGAQVGGAQGQFVSAGGKLIKVSENVNAATLAGFGKAGSNVEKFREIVGTAMARVGGVLEKLPEQIRTVAAKVRKGWDAIGGGAGAAAAAVGVGVTAITAYHTSMSDDTATQVTGVLASLGQIAAAWAIGGPTLGPILAGVTALSAGIGMIFGNAAKQAKKEAAFLKEVEDAAERAGDTFGAALMEFGTSDLGRTAASWKVINEAIEDTDGKLQGIADSFGITFGQVANAITGGGDAVTKFRDKVLNSAVEGVMNRDAKAMERFGDSYGKVMDRLGVATFDPIRFGLKSAGDGAFETNAKFNDLSKALQNNEISINEWADQAKALGADTVRVDAQVKKFKDGITTGIGGTSGFDGYFASLAGEIDKAIAKNEILVKIQESFRAAQERLLSPIERMQAAWDRVKEKIDKASAAFRGYLDSVLGRESSIDQTIISLSERALTDAQGKQEGETDQTAGARLRENERQALYDAMNVVGRFAEEANGDAGKLNASMSEFFKTLIDGATDEGTKQFYRDLQNSPLLAEAMMKALATTDPIKNMTDISDAWGEFVADADNKPIIARIEEAPNFTEQQNAIMAAVMEMVNEDPAIKTYIEEGPGYQAVFESILADKGLLGIGVTIPVSLTPSGKLKEWLDKPFFERFGGGGVGEGGPTIDVEPTLMDDAAAVLQRRLDELTSTDPLTVQVKVEVTPAFKAVSKAIGAVMGIKGVKENYAGGLETSPVLSTLAERGAEAIFPLTNPARMRQIMGIPQVARAFDAAGFGAPITGNAAGTNYAPVTVDQSQVNHFEIHESSPRMTADEIFRRQRKARFHGGHTLPVVIR